MYQNQETQANKICHVSTIGCHGALLPHGAVPGWVYQCRLIALVSSHPRHLRAMVEYRLWAVCATLRIMWLLPRGANWVWQKVGVRGAPPPTPAPPLCKLHWAKCKLQAQRHGEHTEKWKMLNTLLWVFGITHTLNIQPPTTYWLCEPFRILRWCTGHSLDFGIHAPRRMY